MADKRDLPALLELLPEQFKPSFGPDSLGSLLRTSRAVRRATGHSLIQGLKIDPPPRGAQGTAPPPPQLLPTWPMP